MTHLKDGRATMVERRLKALEEEIARMVKDEVEMRRIRAQLLDMRAKIEEIA